MLVLTRQELYEKVWSTPMSRLAADFGISDVALAKVCRKHGIPRPGRGYWAKLAAGVKVRRVALARRGDSVPIEFVHDNRHGRTIPKPVPPVVVVVERPPMLHPAVEWVRSELALTNKDKHGRLTARFSYGCGVAVTKSLVGRTLAILNAFAEALVARGWTLELARGGRDEPSGMTLVVHGQHYWIDLEERLDQRQNPKFVEPVPRRALRTSFELRPSLSRDQLRKYDYVPNGLLRLRISGGLTHHCGLTSWSDDATHKLEDRLGAVVAALEHAAAVQVARDAEEARAAEARQVEERRVRDAKRVAELKRLRPARLVAYEKKLGEELEGLAERWSRAKGVREFLAEYDRRLPQERRSPLEEGWYQAGLRHAERLDPLGEAQGLAKELQPEDEELERLLGE